MQPCFLELGVTTLNTSWLPHWCSSKLCCCVPVSTCGILVQALLGSWVGRAWRLFIVHTASSTIILVFSLWEASSHLQIFHLSLLSWSLGALQVLSTSSLADLTLLCPGPVLGVFISSLYWCHTRWLSCYSVLSYQKKVIKTQESASSPMASTNTSHLLVSNWHNLCNSLISTSLATL